MLRVAGCGRPSQSCVTSGEAAHACLPAARECWTLLLKGCLSAVCRWLGVLLGVRGKPACVTSGEVVAAHACLPESEPRRRV
eukprot:6212920-Pleurochrysis_carterae.AAC.3